MKSLLRPIFRLIFALSGVALLVGLLIFGIWLWDTAVPGIVQAVDAVGDQHRKAGGHAAIIFAPLPLLGVWLWYRLFSWIDRRLLDEGELGEAMAAAQLFALTGENSGVCIYRKRSRFSDLQIPLVIGKDALTDVDPHKPLLRTISPGKLAIGAGAPAPGSLQLRAKPGTLYFICHEISRGSLAGEIGSKTSHFHLMARQARR